MRLLQRLRDRNEWQLFAVLPRADRRLAAAWWAVVLVHGALPAVFALAMGALVGAVQRGESLTAPLALVGVVFVLLPVLTPIQTAVSHNLGKELLGQQQALDGFPDVDDVNLVAHAENERLHARVPRGLPLAEVDAGFDQVLYERRCHG